MLATSEAVSFLRILHIVLEGRKSLVKLKGNVFLNNFRVVQSDLTPCIRGEEKEPTFSGIVKSEVLWKLALSRMTML